MPLDTNSRFSATAVVSLRMLSEPRILEIKFTNSRGVELVVSLPLPEAFELAIFISDVAKLVPQPPKKPGKV